jgi:hypothetical protein
VLYIVMPWELRAEPEVQGVNAPIAVSSQAWQPRRVLCCKPENELRCIHVNAKVPTHQNTSSREVTLKSACAILEWEIVLVGQVHPDYTAISAKVVTEVGYVFCVVYIVFFSGICGLGMVCIWRSNNV